MQEGQSPAYKALQARINATAKGMHYQLAEMWLEKNPEATTKDLLLFLGAQADKARAEAIDAEMATGKMDYIEAAQVVDRYMDYRAPLARELGEG